MNEAHFRRLERMYAAAPFNTYYRGQLEVSQDHARLTLPIQESFMHAAGAVHGTHYFKLLDDSCFFAAQSRVTEVFLLTASFNLYFTRPIVGKSMVGEAKLVSRTARQLIAEGVVLDDQGRECGRGSGVFALSRIPLDEKIGYA